MSKFCQSCSMPLSKDPNGGGSEKDGSKSAKYCSLCYENGEFKQKDITLAQMKALVKEKMRENGFPGFLAGFFASGIGRLERWRNDET